MILGVVSAGVPWPQDTSQHLPLAGHDQRVETEAALVMASRMLLLGMDADRCRIEIEPHLAGRCASRPGASAGNRARPTDLVDLYLAELQKHPTRRRDRRELPEQRWLPSERRQIGNTPAAIRGHHRQIAQNPPRIMSRAALPGPRKRPTKTVRQPETLRRERQQRAPRTRRQARAVRDHIYRSKRRTSRHLQGEPPGRVDWVFANAILPAQADDSRPPRHHTPSHY